MICVKPMYRPFAVLAVIAAASCSLIGLLSGCGDNAQQSATPAVVNQKEVDAAQKGMQEFIASKKQAGKAARKR